MTDQGSDQIQNEREPSPSLRETASGMNRPWLMRVVIITLCLVGYAGWSVYDAYVSYPERGGKYADFAEWQYLGKLIDADDRESPGLIRREGAVVDPVAEFDRLNSEEAQQRNLEDVQGSTRQRRAEMELARLEWLKSLSVIGRLHPAYTGFYRNPDESAAGELAELEDTKANADAIGQLRDRLDPIPPRERYAALSTQWSAESPPAPLRSYDIPVNKIQALICLVFTGYMLFLFVKVFSKTYRWDPESRVITLPNGISIATEDLEDVDKRKWDKFIVYLKIKDSHAQLGGQEVRFDTYRHSHVEEWILDMERVAFPDRADAEAAADAAPAPESPSDEPVIEGEQAPAG